jgi:hypothetical protein
VPVNDLRRWSACSARGQEERDGEPELVALPVPTDLEVHRVRLAVPGAAVESERRVVPHVEPGLAGPCEPLGARRPVEQFEPLAVAECAPPVVPRSRAAHWAPRRELRLPLVQALVFLRQVAALREYAPADWAALPCVHPDARQAAFVRGSVELARLAPVVSPVEGFVRPERLPGVARARDRQLAAGGPLPASADGRDSPRQIAHDWLRPDAYVEPAQEPALCAAHVVPPVRQAWVERSAHRGHRHSSLCWWCNC